MALPSDPADLFVHLVSQADLDFNRYEVFDWMSKDRVRDIADFVERATLNDGRLDPDEIERLIDVTDDDERSERVFTVLLGLDRALAYANPYFGSFDQGALSYIAVRYALTGRLNADVDLGALLPRCAFPGRRESTPNSLNDAFVGVVWVPSADWQKTNHTQLPRRNDLTRRERESGVTIVCVPFIDEADQLSWEATVRNSAGFYRIAPLADKLRGRIAPLLHALDASGAHVAVLPELAVDTDLLDAWLDAIKTCEPPTGSRLKWILVGTGPTQDTSPPDNRCTLIDRITGEVLLAQDKLFPFTLTTTQLAEWRLDDLLGNDDLEEELTCGERILVTESALGRLAILICEDLARLVDLGPSMRSHGISHVFSPVFSKETKAHHWEHAKAKEYANEAGAAVVVANSLVVARRVDADGPWGVALAHSPVATQLRSAYSWDDLATFEITAGDPKPLGGDATVSRGDETLGEVLEDDDQSEFSLG